MNSNAKDKCRNFLQVIDILLCLSFTHEKADERGFSQMTPLKSDFKNQSSPSHMSPCFGISEEVKPVAKSKPGGAIAWGYLDIVWRLGSMKYEYTKMKATKDCQITHTA